MPEQSELLEALKRLERILLNLDAGNQECAKMIGRLILCVQYLAGSEENKYVISKILLGWHDQL